MPGELYKGDPLTPEERCAYEADLISFCDRELDLLGDIRGKNVLYAGGTSPLWLEGLGQRIGEEGYLTAIEREPDLVMEAEDHLGKMDLPVPVRLVVGDVFEPPFEAGTFDLVYSAGLLHELDVQEKPAEEMISASAHIVRPGGQVATSDFVDSIPSAQQEEEEIEAECAYELSGRRPYGIGPPHRLIELHENVLTDLRWRISLPHPLRHSDKIALAEDEPAEFRFLPPATAQRLRARREALLKRIRREGYTRPATLYVEGRVAGR